MLTFRGSRIPVNPRKPTQFPRLHTSHERIPIFMIQDKGASTPCDERHVKYRRNTNVLTQKKTGGKRIMGNQGMTNWKLSVFFVIALTLVAGLFADTALAGNGDGKMALALDGAIVAVDLDTTSGDTDPELVVLKAKSTPLGLTFTYTADDDKGTAATGDDVPINMNGGKVLLTLDAAWKVTIDDHIDTITDGGTGLSMTTARLTDDGGLLANAGIRGPVVKADRDLRRITITENGDGFVTQIEVELDGSEWSADRSLGRKLVITLTELTVPIPSSLGTGRIPFKSYTFYASSSLTGGFIGLDPYSVDGEPRDGDPSVKVGNIASADAGTFEVSPSPTYVGDESNFVITFTAAGPIYNVDANVIEENNNLGQPGDINAQIQIDLSATLSVLKTLPASLPDKDEDGNTLVGPPALTGDHVTKLGALAENGAPVTAGALRSGLVRVTSRSKSANVDNISIDNNVIMIDVSKMDATDKIELTYYKMWAVSAVDATANNYSFIGVAVNSDGTITTGLDDIGEVKARPGSGTIEIADAAVEVNSVTDFNITYTAATDIANAYLIVKIPSHDTLGNALKMPNTEDDTDLVDLTLTDREHPEYPLENVSGTTVDESELPHPNRGGGVRRSYGEVRIVSVSRNRSDVEQDLIDSSVPEGGLSYDTVVWGPLALEEGDTFKGEIERVRITEDTGVYDWSAHLEIREPIENRPVVGMEAGTLTIGMQLHVVRAEKNIFDPDVTFEISEAESLPLSTAGSEPDATIGQGGFSSYNASGRYRITFTFTTERTPIKGGTVSFTIPDDWSSPHISKTSSEPGYTALDPDDAPALAELTVGSNRTITVSKLDLDHTEDKNDSVSITYGAKLNPADNVPDDMLGSIMQPDADDVTIVGYFDVDGDGTIPNTAASEVNFTIGNVDPGSGKATIDPDTVEAGGLVDLTVVYTAQGTMNDGQVALQMPENWGDLQEEDEDADNYVQVTPSGGTLGSWSTNGDIVVVNLDTFDENDTVRFALKNVVAQPSNLGVVGFKIYSAGQVGDDLELVVGEEPPADAYSNEGVDLLELLGRVYRTDCLDDGDTTDEREDYDGLLRVAVTGGGDGSGSASVEIVASENSGVYEVDGEEVKQLHSGDGAKTHLRFTYTPIETIIDGELKFAVPSGWDDPQRDSASAAGFTDVDTTGGRIGSPRALESGSLTVPIYLIDRDDSIIIDYGAAGGAVMPPTSVGPEEFKIEIKGSAAGRFKPIPRQPMVHIRPQATGKGTASVAADGSLYAGSTGNSVTITYTAVGQVVDGDLKITVPENWSPAMSDHFDISGSVVYGGELTAAERADDDPVDNHITDDANGARELIISGIDLRAGASYSVTYEDVTVQDTAAEGVVFEIRFRGDGPGTDFGAAVGVLVDESGAAIDADAQKVDVLDVEPGSGTVEVRGPAVVTVGLTAYEITIIYTADAQISAEKAIAVQIPIGWSDPIDDDAAMDDDGNYNEGTYTVVHKNADGTSFTDRYGDPIDGMVEKADVADRMLMASVTGDGVAAGETVIFTFQNATASADAGPSTFQVYYDGAQVESDDDVVLVQSGEGAAMLALSSEEDTFIIDEGGSLTVTVMLQADDGSAATRAVDTVIALESSSDNGSFDPATVTIAAGETMGTSDYSDGSVGSVEITASTDATDVAAADALTITANTEMPMLESVDFSPKVAKDLTTITVTAVGTPFQNPTFMIEDINFSGISMTEDAGDGTYTGSHRLARGSAEGMHSVTVSINGVNLAADDMLTVDNTAPKVEVTAPAAGMTVVNGEMITISATVTDAADVTVTADVSMLDSEAEADSVTLTDGSGMHTIDMNNSNLNDEYTITVMATDAAGNVGEGMVMVMLDNTKSFTSMIPSGLSMFHVPLMVEGMDTIGDLKAALGDDVISAIPYHGGKWEPDSDDVEITADLGMFLVTKGAIEHEFVGHPWGGGSAMISVTAGANNLIGVPVADPNVTMISDIIGLFPADVVQTIVTASGDGEYPQISGADDPDDAEVKGDAAYLVIAASDGSAMVSGAGWSTGGMASAAPIALSGYQLDTQTPLISVYGSVVDEITGLAREGFRAKVKNLSTKAALSEITSVEAADGYSITFVDLTDAHAARVGDVLEISADSPDPLVGVKPVRHIVTVDDVKNSRIELESLIAYEIPAETELLRNYPNPFNPETWIPYRLAEDADVSLTIYDAYGATVRSIDIGHQIAAVYDTRAKAIYWDGRNRFGEQVASGLYFYHLSAGDFSGTRRMVILK